MKKQYSFEEFTDIIKTLRSENGCPWDREQTHNSLKPCMTEEAAELLAAIRIYDKTGDFGNMKEELGDILLQVVMHSQIANEEGLFSIEDVISGISQKMIQRHPHVFGTIKVETSEEVLSNWEEIKKKEKETLSYTVSPLLDIPIELPALAYADKVLKKQDKLYEKTPNIKESILKVKELLTEMETVLENDETGKELLKNNLAYSFLFLSNIAMKSKISSEQLLRDKIGEIIDKYEPKKW